MDTHWSRILYHDLFSEPADRVARSRDAPTDADFKPGRSPIGAAVILLGVFIATYLAVAGLVRVLSGPDTTSVVMRQTGVMEGNQSADPERAALVLRS